jgi:muramoyltetrapeptide carboxypeptidase
LIGFSDNTALLLAVLREGVVGFHGPHPGAGELSDLSLALLKELVEIPEATGQLPMPRDSTPRGIVAGRAEGRLVGGNLSLMASLLGTPYQPPTAGAIVFLEEIAEPAYRLDRLLTQLLMGGVFDQAAGVAIGAISETPTEPDGMPTPVEVVRDRLGGLRVPVVYDLPFGHIPRTWTLPLGIRARLDTDDLTLSLLESAVL